MAARLLGLIGTFLLGLAGPAAAATIVDVGTVRVLSSPQDPGYVQMGVTRFTATGGAVRLDVRGRSFDAGPSGTGLRDPYLYLFADDGDITLADFVALNDDRPRGTVTQGYSALDSALETTLAAGSYVAYVGMYQRRGAMVRATSTGARAENIARGYQFFDGTDPGLGAARDGRFRAQDYQITISGAVAPGPAVIPLPATVWLLGAAVLGLAGSRRLRTHRAAALRA